MQKGHGYRLHEQIADVMDRPRYQSGYHPNGSISLVAAEDVVCGSRGVIIQEGEIVFLIDTMNAGFRGIEGTVRAIDGTEYHGVSLDHFRLAD